ncbi:MAG: hypothetical protein AAF799_12360 [Myxococcota bacterium]
MIVCIIPEGSVSEPHQRTLESSLPAIVAEHLGPKVRPVVVWNPVAAGNGYTGGQARHCSLCHVQVPADTSLPQRAALMRAVCEQWCETTGMSRYELMVTTPDKATVRGTLRALLAPMRPGAKASYLGRLATQAARQRWQRRGA